MNRRLFPSFIHHYHHHYSHYSPLISQSITPLIKSNFCTSNSIVARKKASQEITKHARHGRSEIADTKYFPKNIVVDKDALNNNVNSAIQNFFQSPPEKLPQVALDQLIQSSANAAVNSPVRWSLANVATLMFTAAKQKKSFNRKEKKKSDVVLSLDAHVPTIIKMLEDRKDEPIGNRDISNLCYGLKSLKSLGSSSKKSTRLYSADPSMTTTTPTNESSLIKSESLPPPMVGLLNVLSNRLDKFEGQLTKVDVGKIVYGMQGLSSDSLEVRKFLPSISNVLSKCIPDDEAIGLNSSAVGSALYGLQGMKSKHSEVLTLVDVLRAKLEKSERYWDAMAIGNALYGLQNMTSKSEEVRKLVAVLAVKASQSRFEMGAQELSNAIYGLKCMTSESPEVRSLLISLTEKLDECDERFTPQSISKLLFGLRGMNSAHDEVKDLLLAVSKKLDKNKQLDAVAVGHACSGLKHMDAEHIEVRMLLDVLRIKILRCEQMLSPDIIRKSIIGVRALYAKSLALPVVDNSSAAMLAFAGDSNKDALSAVLAGRVCQHMEVEGLIEALRVKAVDPAQVDELLCKYLQKANGHFQ